MSVFAADYIFACFCRARKQSKGRKRKYQGAQHARESVYTRRRNMQSRPNKKQRKMHTRTHAALLCKFVFLLSGVILHDVIFCPHCYHFEKLHHRAFIRSRSAPARPRLHTHHEYEKLSATLKI